VTEAERPLEWLSDDDDDDDEVNVSANVNGDADVRVGGDAAVDDNVEVIEDASSRASVVEAARGDA
jgi:hypothetical protein